MAGAKTLDYRSIPCDRTVLMNYWAPRLGLTKVSQCEVAVHDGTLAWAEKELRQRSERRERKRASDRRCYEKRLATMAADQAYRERYTEARRAWRLSHRDIERNRARRWREANRERERMRKRLWARANRGKIEFDRDEYADAAAWLAGRERVCAFDFPGSKVHLREALVSMGYECYNTNHALWKKITNNVA